MKLDSEDKQCRSFKNLYFPIVYFSFHLCKLFLPREHDMMMKYYYVKLLFFIHFFGLLCKLFSSVNFIGLIRVIEGPFCLLGNQ